MTRLCGMMLEELVRRDYPPRTTEWDIPAVEDFARYFHGTPDQLSTSTLFVQDYAKEATVNRQRAVARVIDKAQRPELVHEMTDPRPGGTNHLGQVFLIDSGMDSFGPAFLTKMRQQ